MFGVSKRNTQMITVAEIEKSYSTRESYLFTSVGRKG